MSENTKIVQCFLPPMVAGKYTAAVKQSIVISRGSKLVTEEVKPVTVESIPDIEKTFDFGVDAARFVLSPDDIYSVYPPANQFGHYSESLPHVVFTRRTLPWERTIDGKPPVFQREETHVNKKNPQESPPVPWMALMLFNEDEMKDLQITKSTIAAIIQPETPDTIIRPEIFENTSDDDKLSLMEWENKDDGCFTIDITKEQFNKHIPSLESLSYLAHAKEVSIANKDKNGITDLNDEGEGVFAVIVGNRLPTPGKQHNAILVSLEGFANYLRDKDPNAEIPDENKVRLVVLANWNFGNSGDASFLSLVNGIEIKSMKIKRDHEASELLPYFDSGYTPLEHLTRTGVTTLSWYHGPFLPMPSPAMSKSISFSSSDAALRYDKTTGFFDISFAAAWQLGRMLALQNQGFSKAILNWRIAQKQLEVGKSRKDLIDIIVNDHSEIPLKDKVISYLGNINGVQIAKPQVQVTDTLLEIPKDVKDFLGDLYALKGVPFTYLVPHEFLLEKEHTNNNNAFTGTLALFYVDPNWVEALLDGALSIGRISNTDTILDKVMSGEFTSNYVPQKLTNPATGKGDIQLRILNITGFLFRSDLISGWRGLEIEAYDANNNLLPALRFERIDADIFLGIFNGNVSSIVITQPYEGLHFGIKIDEDEYKKNLKNEDGTNQSVTDGTADVSTEINNGLISKGILDIAGIAKLMKQKLSNKGWMNTEGESDGKYFTSAEFAYQMVDSPVKRTIVVNMIVE